MALRVLFGGAYRPVEQITALLETVDEDEHGEETEDEQVETIPASIEEDG